MAFPSLRVLAIEARRFPPFCPDEFVRTRGARPARRSGVTRGGAFTDGNEALIDSDLIELALEVSGERTKKAAVTKAMQEFIARRRQKRQLDLVGKLEWDASFDYKAERKARLLPVR